MVVSSRGLSGPSDDDVTATLPHFTIQPCRSWLTGSCPAAHSIVVVVVAVVVAVAFSNPSASTIRNLLETALRLTRRCSNSLPSLPSIGHSNSPTSIVPTFLHLSSALWFYSSSLFLSLLLSLLLPTALHSLVPLSTPTPNGILPTRTRPGHTSESVSRPDRRRCSKCRGVSRSDRFIGMGIHIRIEIAARSDGFDDSTAIPTTFAITGIHSPGRSSAAILGPCSKPNKWRFCQSTGTVEPARAEPSWDSQCESTHTTAVDSDVETLPSRSRDRVHNPGVGSEI